jgi:hypothetical protein
MSDGAHLGVGAERALQTILGGKPSPAPAERMDAPTFERWIRAAPEDPQTYDDGGRFLAKLMLEVALASDGAGRLSVDELYDAAKEHAGADRWRPLEENGVTGFMAGWAANAARWLCELGPLPNPAIIDVRLPRR